MTALIGGLLVLGVCAYAMARVCRILVNLWRIRKFLPWQRRRGQSYGDVHRIRTTRTAPAVRRPVAPVVSETGTSMEPYDWEEDDGL